MIKRAQVRLTVYEWARRQATGRLRGLDWVDHRVRVLGRPKAVVRIGGKVHIRFDNFAKFLPGPMIEAVQEAQESGEPTAIEALTLMFARFQWMVESRGFWWKPFGPMSALWIPLVEAYGIDADIHGRDPDTLARLMANLPNWYPYRGDPDRAGWLLEDAAGLPLDVDLDQTSPDEMDEVYVCRGASWFMRRGVDPTNLKIDGGFVRLAQDGVESSGEDVLVGWSPGTRFPHHLLRLLPAWASVRLKKVNDA